MNIQNTVYIQIIRIFIQFYIYRKYTQVKNKENSVYVHKSKYSIYRKIQKIRAKQNRKRNFLLYYIYRKKHKTIHAIKNVCAIYRQKSKYCIYMQIAMNLNIQKA